MSIASQIADLQTLSSLVEEQRRRREITGKVVAALSTIAGSDDLILRVRADEERLNALFKKVRAL